MKLLAAAVMVLPLSPAAAEASFAVGVQDPAARAHHQPSGSAGG